MGGFYLTATNPRLEVSSLVANAVDYRLWQLPSTELLLIVVLCLGKKKYTPIEDLQRMKNIENVLEMEWMLNQIEN